MYFDSIQAAWQMDGHGPYVWGAYLSTLFVIALLIIGPVMRAKTARKQLLAESRRLSASSALGGKNEAAASHQASSGSHESAVSPVSTDVSANDSSNGSTTGSTNASTPKGELNASET